MAKQTLSLHLMYTLTIHDQATSWSSALIIDREAREIMYLVASVRPSVRLTLVKSSPKSGRSIDYPLTKIRLSILGQGFECTAIKYLGIRM